LTFFGAVIAISVSPGAGDIHSADTRCAARLLEHSRPGGRADVATRAGRDRSGRRRRDPILAFNVIKWIGVVYLLYLAIRQWRTAPLDLREQIGHAVDGGRIALLVPGFLVNATNPKSVMFFPRRCRSS
jgi:homoserine/homoserine lactone efflux protein